MKKLLSLFLTMLKIGVFTFGGGYAMIAVFRSEFVEKKKWLTSEEFTNLVAIGESTPGPIAINSATYIGYKTHGFLGSLLATIAICLPSLVIIYIISLFFDAFVSLEFVAYAFSGIRVCVTYLILSAGIKMFKSLKIDIFAVVFFALTLIMIFLSFLFNFGLSSIIYILIGGVCGIATGTIRQIKNKEKEKENEK